MTTAYILSCRKYNEVEIKKVVWSTSKSGQGWPLNPVAASLSRSITLSRATPSLPKALVSTCSAPVIDKSVLTLPQDKSHTSNNIGSGRFGACVQMVYKDMFLVCAKELTPDVSLRPSNQKQRLVALNSCQYIPPCFGVCLARRAIVMSYISIAGKSVNLHTALSSVIDGLELNTTVYMDVLIQLCQGLQFVHTKGFLHNDLKVDNVVLGHSYSKTVKPYVVDFGKACTVGDGKCYGLSQEEKKRYKQEHAHVAPDLCDGPVSQSFFD